MPRGTRYSFSSTTKNALNTTAKSACGLRLDVLMLVMRRPRPCFASSCYFSMASVLEAQGDGEMSGERNFAEGSGGKKAKQVVTDTMHSTAMSHL